MGMTAWKELDWSQKLFVGLFVIFSTVVGLTVVDLKDSGFLEMNPLFIVLIGVMVMSALAMLIDVVRNG